MMLQTVLARTELLPDTLPPLVTVEGVSRRLGNHQALADIHFTIADGDIVGIIGRSGAGKSTLIRCLSGLERVDQGAITIEQTDIARLDDAALQKVRRRIGLVFQHFNLLSAKTTEENVALPLLIGGVPKAERKRRVAELLELVGLSDHARKYPAQLSGGQKQRVGIARALAASPALLLCDEATSALDPETTTSILALLADINQRLGVTIVIITHEMSVIRALAHQVIVLDQGRVVEEGPVAEVFAAPRHEITQSLLRGFRPDLPAPLAASLRPQPGVGYMPLLRIDLAGSAAQTTLLSDVTDRFGIATRLLHGGIEDVRGTAIGTLFISPGVVSPSLLSDLLAYLAARSQATELLGYVPDSY